MARVLHTNSSLVVPPQPSLTLTEKYGRGSQRWLLLHAALIVAGHGVVAAAVLLDELYLHGVLLNASNSIAVVSLCGAAAVLGTLSLLVHAILPADMSVAEFLWVRGSTPAALRLRHSPAAAAGAAARL